MRTLALLVAMLCLSEGVAVAQDPFASSGSRPGTGKQLHFNVLIADLPADSDVNSLGPEELAKQIVALDQQGQLRHATRIPLTTLDQTSASIQFGKRVAVETGRTSPGGGRAPMTAYSIQEGGTLVQLTPALQDNGLIVVECVIEQSRIPEGETGDEAQATPATNVKAETITVKTTVRLQSGQSVLVGGQKTVRDKEIAQTWIVLTGSVEKEAK